MIAAFDEADDDLEPKLKIDLEGAGAGAGAETLPAAAS